MDKTPKKIEVEVETPPSMDTAPRSGQVRTVTMELPESTTLAFSKDTVFFILYLLYKTNAVSRVNLKQMLKEIEKELPENVPAFLVREAARA